MRILFFGDDAIAVAALQHLRDLGKYAIVGVVLRRKPRNDALRTYAEQQGFETFQPTDVNSDEFYRVVTRLKPDLNLIVNYDQIFKQRLIQSAHLGTVNCHNGLLPNYRGGGGLYGALVNNERYFGQTLHWVNEEIDGGDIIVQDILPIEPNDYMDDLLAKAVANVPQLVARGLERLAQPGFVARKQDPTAGSYFPKKPEGDEVIDWSEQSVLLLSKIRARNPGPGNVAFLRDKKIYVWRASPTNTPVYVGPVGQIIHVEPGRGVRVKTGDSAILIEEIQFEGEAERRVPHFPIGTTFLSNWRAAYVELKQKYADLETRLRRLEARLPEPPPG